MSNFDPWRYNVILRSFRALVSKWSVCNSKKVGRRADQTESLDLGHSILDIFDLVSISIFQSISVGIIENIRGIFKGASIPEYLQSFLDTTYLRHNKISVVCCVIWCNTICWQRWEIKSVVIKAQTDLLTIIFGKLVRTIETVINTISKSLYCKNPMNVMTYLPLIELSFQKRSNCSAMRLILETMKWQSFVECCAVLGQSHPMKKR